MIGFRSALRPQQIAGRHIGWRPLCNRARLFPCKSVERDMANVWYATSHDGFR